MIGPGGLLLASSPPCICSFQFQFYWWGCPKKKKKTAKLRHLILLTIQSYILSTVGDALSPVEEDKRAESHCSATGFDCGFSVG
jgi:hypothetical protein